MSLSCNFSCISRKSVKAFSASSSPASTFSYPLMRNLRGISAIKSAADVAVACSLRWIVGCAAAQSCAQNTNAAALHLSVFFFAEGIEARYYSGSIGVKVIKSDGQGPIARKAIGLVRGLILGRRGRLWCFHLRPQHVRHGGTVDLSAFIRVSMSSGLKVSCRRSAAPPLPPSPVFVKDALGLGVGVVDKPFDFIDDASGVVGIFLTGSNDSRCSSGSTSKAQPIRHAPFEHHGPGKSVPCECPSGATGDVVGVPLFGDQPAQHPQGGSMYFLP